MCYQTSMCGRSHKDLNLALYAWVPQLVEGPVHTRFVGGSNPPLGTTMLGNGE